MLNQVISLTALAQNLPTALQQACAVLARFLAPQGAVAVFDDDQTVLNVIAEYQEGDAPSALGTQIAGIGNPSIDAILADKAPLAISDADTHPLLAPVHDLMQRRNTKSLLLVPMLIGDEVRGTLGLDFHTPRRFDAEELQLAQNVANQLGQVLQRLTLYTQSMEHARLATMLSDLGERLNRSFTLAEVFQAIGEGAMHLSGSDRCAVFARNPGDVIQCAWAKGITAASITAILDDLRGAATTRLLDTAEPIFLNDVQRMPADSLLRRLGVAEGYGSVAAWPLVFENRTVASVVCFHDDTRRWPANEREVMASFARQATSTLENARLFGEAQRRAAELERLSQISSALRSARDRHEIQSVILDELLTLLGTQNGAVVLRNVDTAELVLAETRGDTLNLSGMSLSSSACMTLDIVESGRPYVAANLYDDERFDRYDLVETPVAAVCAPLIVDERSIGALWVIRPQPFTDTEVNLILAVADIGAAAIHRAREVETLEQHVQARTQQLAEANVRLTELDVLKSKFVSDVSHELRTPIQNLKMYLDLLERGRPEKRSVYLNTLQDQVDLLKRLTEDILDLSRLELNPERGDFEDVEINQLISQVYTSLRPRAESRGLTVSVQLDPLLPMIRADAGQMVQVVNNLLENAINYTLAGSVRISTKRADNGVCLQVEDSGMGISQNDMAHLFDRFYRSNRVSQSNIRGTGLGLAIVNEIVQKHNGRIEVESEEEIGSTFRVWFPVDGVTDLRA
ncbi:MAG: GAF domain-containing sensor histidine kinase [Caldilineaceae bacterium]